MWNSGHIGCEGCEWERDKHAVIKRDERTGYRWKYCCPGTACANWKRGTPMNIDCGCSYYKQKYQLDIFDFIGKEGKYEVQL